MMACLLRDEETGEPINLQLRDTEHDATQLIKWVLVSGIKRGRDVLMEHIVVRDGDEEMEEAGAGGASGGAADA